ESCQRYRAELASLGHGISGRQAGRLAQLMQYRQSLGCSGAGGFFGFTPPECDVVDPQISALRGVAGQDDGNRERRRELRNLVSKFCAAPSGQREEESASESVGRGGGELICVRACDGGYFPMDWPA